MIEKICPICGKAYQTDNSTKICCSFLCNRLHQTTRTAPPARPKKYTLTFDTSSIPIGSNALQVDFFESILQGLDIPYERDVTVFGYHYDLKIEQSKVLICAATTLSEHAYANTDVNIHRTKSIAAQIEGYRCVEIYDWDDPVKILSSFVPKIELSAHDCTVQPVSITVADIFHNMYNFDDAVEAKINYGLYYNDLLVQCMSFRPLKLNDHSYRISRLCSDPLYKIHGGASKLFKAFIRDIAPSKVVAYCDCNKFTGDVFSCIGMRRAAVDEPMIMWSKGIDKIPNVVLSPSYMLRTYGVAVSEFNSPAQIMLEQGWIPVVVAGKSRYEWYNQ